MFNFKRQLKRYGRPYTIIINGEPGYYDQETGVRVPPSDPMPQEVKGIIAQLSDDDYQYGDGGTLSTLDRKILFDTDEYRLQAGQTVIIDEDAYKVMPLADYSRYSHFGKAIVKRVTRDG